MSDEEIKKLIKLVAAVIGGCVLVLLVFLIVTLVRDARTRKEYESIEASVAAEQNRTDPVAGYEARTQTADEKEAEKGEAGDADYQPNAGTGDLNGEGEVPTRQRLAELAIGSNGKIAYSRTGSDEIYRKGYLDTDGTAGNRNPMLDLLEENGGMDSFGYLVWLFRNTFGSTPLPLADFDTMMEHGDKISSAELECGDIGMVRKDGEESNRFGVCIGYFDGHPLFAYCCSFPGKQFPDGCSHISYLASENNAYFNGTAPVEFEYFIRLPLEWQEGTK